MIVQENIPLTPLTTLKVGGPAQYFIEAKSVSEVQEAAAFARSKEISMFVLGGGSNLLVADSGFSGLVLKIGIAGIEARAAYGQMLFHVGAGEEWDKFVASAVARNCAGIECLSGIPGSVGGTPVQNVGAYGQEVAEAIQSVSVLNLQNGEISEMKNDQCGFRYRTSIFNTDQKGRYIILSVTFALVPNGAPRLSYADLKNHFVGWRQTPSLADVREAVRKIRARKGMLITAGDEDCRSAGSFFKNPVLSAEVFEKLARLAAEKNLQIPSYPALEAQRKVSAAWLVEHSGFSKGFTHGNVGISRKHALAIVNRGQASAAEVIALKNHIQERVQELWQIELEPEPVFVGF